MAEIFEINTLSSPELEVYTKLTQAQLRNKQQPEKGVFIVEGTKVIEIALARGLKPISFLMEKKHIGGKARELIGLCPSTPVYTAGSELLKELTGFELTRGVLCAMHRPAPEKPVDILSGAKRIAVLENIVDASNLGAIFRSAAALGMDGIILSPSCCDPLYRKAVRTSMGTVFQISWCRYEGKWPVDGMKLLNEHGFETAALALREDAISLEDSRLAGINKLALILGTEGSGLEEETINASDHCVYIPMYNEVNSLNVAAAAAIAFWQLKAK